MSALINRNVIFSSCMAIYFDFTAQMKMIAIANTTAGIIAAIPVKGKSCGYLCNVRLVD
jgi:hypothetical protein